MTVRNAYPVRLSTDELRQELEAYVDERQQRAGRAASTLDLDRRKVEYFLHWPDTGELPSESAGRSRFGRQSS
jgi:hypothetical protein